MKKNKYLRSVNDTNLLFQILVFQYSNDNLKFLKF